MNDVALSGILLWRSALSSEVARVTTIKAGVTEGGPNGWWCKQVQHKRRWR
jgi:hypothetical protein